MFYTAATRKGTAGRLKSCLKAGHDAGACKEGSPRSLAAAPTPGLKFESGGTGSSACRRPRPRADPHVACTVAVMPEADEIADVVLNPAELADPHLRASGAGGST